MADLSDEDWVAAEERGRALAQSGPRAISARFDRRSRRIVMEMGNGCAYAFPVALVEDLQEASDESLSTVAVDGAGFNLHFPTIDVDLFVPALVSGIFGTKAWMTRELAAHAGRSRSAAKVAAARSNGSKGGRPKKAAG